MITLRHPETWDDHSTGNRLDDVPLTMQGAMAYIVVPDQKRPEMLTSRIQTSLRQQAYPVYNPPGKPADGMSARQVACELWPFIYAASTRHGEDEMRRVCAQLAGMAPAGWEVLVDPLEVSLSTTAAAILPRSTPEAVRAALAFWAWERDPAEWQRVINTSIGL